MRQGADDDQTCVVFKYGAHGLSHGHYDKLHYIFYDQNQEILPDYGAARFLNVEQKYGGRYLPENNSYAVQTVAHNTLVVDETSQYGGKEAESEQHHANLYFQDISNLDFQIVSAEDNTAYKDVAMRRTIALIQPEGAKKPFVLDIYKVQSKTAHQYDLPFHYLGHLIATNFDYKAFSTERKTVGKKSGFQHLWLEARGSIERMSSSHPLNKNTEGVATTTFLTGNRYYSVSTTVDTATEILMTRIGANDPNFNLRNEQGFLIRKNAANMVFATVIEPHGSYDGRLENSSQSASQLDKLSVLHDDETATVVAVKFKNGTHYRLCIANDTALKTANHAVVIDGQKVNWTGAFLWNVVEK